MSTTGGRQTIRITVPDYCAHYAGYPVDTADLIARDGVWWLHVVVLVFPAPILPEARVGGAGRTGTRMYILVPVVLYLCRKPTLTPPQMRQKTRKRI
jgi:hypothetical protein